MVLNLSIREKHFDAIRRGLKPIEYRPYCDFYHSRFDDRYITEIIFGHQQMRDKLSCKVKISTGKLPLALVSEWQDIYKEKHSHRKVYYIQIVGIPRYFVSDSDVNQKYPIRFG